MKRTSDVVIWTAEDEAEANSLAAYADNECAYFGKPIVVLLNGEVYHKAVAY